MFDFIISTAHAQTNASQPQQSPFIQFIPFILIFMVMYFFMIRPQKKKMEQEQALLSKLSHGDEVFTKSGILGKITAIAEKVVTLELEGGAKMKVLKSHIGGLASGLLNEQKK